MLADPQALTHFSYSDSKLTHLLTDVQGWRPDSCTYIFTDPAFHTNGKAKRFSGDSDRGKKGFDDFFKVHRCNDICKLLNLHKAHAHKF